jgi:hypothetical protein
MTARTPGHFFYIDSDFNVCHGSQIMEPLEIVSTIESLTADNAWLRETLIEALREIDALVLDGTLEHLHVEDHGAIKQARAALAGKGGER